MVQITKRGGGELQSPEADVIQGLVIEDHALVGVLNQLVDGQRGVVRLYDRVGHLRGRNNREGHHHTIGVFLAHLAHEQGAHARPGAATKGVAKLESLDAVATLGLLPDDVKNRVHKLSSLRIMPLGPVVSGAGLAEDEVVGPKDLTVRAGPDRIHGPWLLRIRGGRDSRAACNVRWIKHTRDSRAATIHGQQAAPGQRERPWGRSVPPSPRCSTH